MTEAIIEKSPFPLNWFKQLITDKALLAIITTLVIVGFISTEQLYNTLTFTGETLTFLLPFLVFAFALAAYMKATSAEVIITQVFHGKTVAMIFAAAFFGAWSPLCSCTVIALIAVLLRSGMPLSAVMAFWISSPIISPDMYVYTAALLGFEFATVKMIAAVFMGLTAGFLVLSLEKNGFFSNPLKDGHFTQKSSLGDVKHPKWKFWQDKERVTIFWKELRSVAWLLGKWMTFAFILESLMISYIPASSIASSVGGDSLIAIPLATLVGVPAYVNGVAAVPLIQGLLQMGMSKGAALAFMCAGSVTSIPAMMAVYPLVKRSVFVTYIGIALVTSVIAGYAYMSYLTIFN